jgi:hypothetical protein
MLVCAMLGAAPACGAPPAECPPAFLGSWEYRQRAGPGYDAEGERIELACSGGSLRGRYFGLEREGEEGLYYTLVEVTELQVTPDGAVSFTVPERELFYERPATFQDVQQRKLRSAGITRDELYMRARLENGKLVVACTSHSPSCPETVMVFHKDQWGPS